MSTDRAAFFFYGTLRNPSWMRSFNAVAEGTVALPDDRLIAPRGHTPGTHKLKGWSLLRPNGLGFPIIRQLHDGDAVVGTVAYVSGPLVPKVIEWLDAVESEGSMYDRVKAMATPVRYYHDDSVDAGRAAGHGWIKEEEGEPEEVSVYVPTKNFLESLAFAGEADYFVSGDWLNRIVVNKLDYKMWAQP